MPEFTIAPPNELGIETCQHAEVAIVANPDPSELSRLPSLKWVHSLWAGVERLVRELADESVAIVRLVDPQMVDTMAEAVLAWVLYLHRDMPRYRRQQQQRIWLPYHLPEAGERIVGIAGLGALGSRAAEILRDRGFTVCGWSRSERSVDGVETYSGPASLHEMASRCNIIVCLVPLTDETRGLFDVEIFAAMPQGASLINFARGPLVNTGDLLAKLDDGHLDHAVLDVFDVEPLPQDSPLWNHPQITVLPHVSGPTNMRTASTIVAKNIRRYIETGEIPQAVDRKLGY